MTKREVQAGVPQSEVTELLEEIQSSPEMFDNLMPLVYEDLKRIGHVQRRRLGGSATLQTTALVHEAFLKLRGNANNRIENRLHFQRLAACVMRQLILDYARRQLSAKRGGDQLREIYDEECYELEGEDTARVIEVEKALQEMAERDQRMAEAAAAQLFAGYTVEEIGEMLGISSRTVIRDLRRARAWLKVELADYKPD